MKNKKRIAALFLSLTLSAALLSGCGENKSANAGSSIASSSQAATSNAASLGYESDAVEKALAIVTLGEYKGLSVRVPDENTVTDDELREYANQNILTGSASFLKDETKTTVEADSIVNVNYQGLLDGVAFDGGTAENVTIDVKNNSDAIRGSGYITGFTSGLPGAKVGDTIDCPVTFPEGYGNQNLAGKDVIFRFKINHICSKVTYDTVTDAFVKENFDLEKASDFKDYVRNEYKSYADKNKSNLKRMAVIDAVMNNAKYDGDLSEDEKTEYTFLAICSKEGLSLDETGYSDYLSNYMSAYGFTDKDEFLKALGDETVLKDYYMAYKAIDLCVDSANVV